jgi:hypothetical protein
VSELLASTPQTPGMGERQKRRASSVTLPLRTSNECAGAGLPDACFALAKEASPPERLVLPSLVRCGVRPELEVLMGS